MEEIDKEVIRRGLLYKGKFYTISKSILLEWDENHIPRLLKKFDVSRHAIADFLLAGDYVWICYYWKIELYSLSGPYGEDWEPVKTIVNPEIKAFSVWLEASQFGNYVLIESPRSLFVFEEDGILVRIVELEKEFAVAEFDSFVMTQWKGKLWFFFRDCTLKALDENFKIVKTLSLPIPPHDSERLSCLTSDEKFLYSGSDDGKVRKWDPESCIKSISGHKSSIRDLLLWKGYLLSAARESVKIWSRNLEELGVFVCPDYTSHLLSVAHSQLLLISSTERLRILAKQREKTLEDYPIDAKRSMTSFFFALKKAKFPSPPIEIAIVILLFAFFGWDTEFTPLEYVSDLPKI